MSSNPPVYYNYIVKSGDTLSGIIHKMYGQSPSSPGYHQSLNFLLSLNPQIKNPNSIYPGNIIHLGLIPESHQKVGRVTAQSHTPLQPSGIKIPQNATPVKVSPQDADCFWALAWLENNSNDFVIPGSIMTGATSNLLSPGNTSLITKISDLYAEYKKGIITKGQYDYQRKVVLEQLKKNVGPMEKLLFGNKTAREAIRIARGGGVPTTAFIERNFQRLSRVASYGKYGGIVLTGVGLAASCAQIANTKDKHEKNEIFVDTMASTIVGAGTGVLVGIFLVSNPIGWGAALVLAIGSAAVSYTAGKVAVATYDAFGNQIDIVNGVGVDKVCR